jgi:hypothetical protein
MCYVQCVIRVLLELASNHEPTTMLACEHVSREKSCNETPNPKP